MKILLTGASGFLGSALARHWGAVGHEVLGLVRSGSSLHRLATAGSSVRTAAAESPRELAAAVSGYIPDAVVHTACSYGRAGESPLQVFQANLALGITLMQAVLEADRRRTLFLNTGTVLGSDVSLYAMSKNQFSQWGSYLAIQMPEALQFVDVRLQHMFGPGDDPSKFITHVVRNCAAHETTLALTAGTQRRDFIYIEDVVTAYDILLANASGLGTSEQIDVGSGYAPEVREVVSTIHRLTHSRTSLDFGALALRTGEAMHCVADTNRMSQLGWRAAYTLEAGLRKTILEEVQIP